WRAVEEGRGASAAGMHVGHAQCGSVGMRGTRKHCTNDEAVEATGNRFYTVNFQARHSDLIRQRIAINRRVHPFA
ncbi:hypothetical protein, partial [Pseudomonas aeruginosa]|uniref:hypothetical protein n=1 Tax=Pseudomonas aeruginosa TaxID=287 RepID=UPI0035572670